MEELTKHQVVLVTLFVSFVTSIATGIVTVSLMQQAPAGVTQTINRVVERTVEQVAPNTAPVNIPPAPITEEDLMVNAIQKNSQSLVKIFASSTESVSFAGLGFIVSKEGVVVADRSVADTGYTAFNATLSDGSVRKLTYVSKDASDRLLFFALTRNKQGETFPSASLGNSDNLKLGQTLLALSGKGVTVVSRGIVTSLARDASSTVSFIETDMLSQPAAPLFNLSGEVVGLKASSYFTGDNGESQILYLPIQKVKSQLGSVISLLSATSTQPSGSQNFLDLESFATTSLASPAGAFSGQR